MPATFSTRPPFVPAVEQLNPDIYLPFEPLNENGVVFIFALAASRLGFDVKQVQAGFPDCTATWAGRPVRIEFEFRSKNFQTHGHDAELRKFFGQARDVFLIAYRDQFWRHLPAGREPTDLWSVPSTSGPDDLLLIYRPPEPGENDPGALTDVFRVATAPERVTQPGWRSEPDWMASTQRVAHLRSPIPFGRLGELGAHGGIESRPRRSEQWPALHRAILEEGQPTHSLARFAPV